MHVIKRMLLSYTCRTVGGFSDTLQMASTPVSLQNLCLIYIIRFLELFPVDYLALLPVTVRQRLLENLPPADVCRLEQSKFSEGLDINRAWKKLSDVSRILTYNGRCTTYLYLHLHKHYTCKEAFFNHIYSFLATNNFSKGLNFETSLAEHRYKIVQCLCTPLRPQTRIHMHKPVDVPANEHGHKLKHWPILPSHDWSLEQLPYWSLLDGSQEFPISTPNRYLPYYQPLPPFLSEKDSIKSIVLLTPTLCHYYPTALDININGFSNTVLWELLNFTDDSTLFTTFFQQVEILSFALRFADESKSKHAVPVIKKQCQKCIQTILPPARRVLQQLVIKANSTEALGYMLECIPILQETLQTPQQSPRHTYTTLFPSLREVTVAVFYTRSYMSVSANLLPLTKQQGRLLQHFSTIIFLSPQCNSFTIDGIMFQDTPSSQPFGSILHSFLTSSTTHEQRLILRRVNVSSTSLPPPVVTPECGLHYKSLVIEKLTIPNSVISWLLEKCELHLKTLQLGFKELKPQLLSTGSPQAAALTQPFKNVHVQTLALHTGSTRNVSPYFSPQVHTLSYKILEQILLKPTLKCLDLSYNGLGSNRIVPHLTEALERRVQTVGTLQELNLACNHLGYVTDDNLQRLFNAIFSLPQLPELSLNILNNEFGLHHFTMLYTCWTKSSSGVKLQYLNYSVKIRIHWNLTQQERDTGIRYCGRILTQQDLDTHRLIEETMAKLAIKCRPARPAALY